MKKQLYLFIALFSSVFPQPIINIDEEAGTLQVSEYIRNSALQFYDYPEANKSIDYISSNDTIQTDNPYTIELISELDGIIINDMNIKYNDVTLGPGLDYVVVPKISNKVYPTGYFNQNKYNNGFKFNNTVTQCTYTNPGPTYTVEILKNVTVDRYVSFANYNFGIDNKSPGIKVITLSNFQFNIQTLDTFIKRKSTPSVNTDDIIFREIHVSQPNFGYNSYLFAESMDSNIYIWEILDTPDDVEITKVNFYSQIAMNTFNISDFKQIDIYKGLMILGGKEGFIVANKTDEKWSIIYRDNKIIVDFITNNKTVYVIEENFGMRIFDLINMKFSAFEFKHPYLTRFDWAYDPFSQLFFIGVAVDNQPPQANEIFIEMIVQTSDNVEFDPHINKIIVSSHQYSGDNIITDSYYGVTYLYDPETMNIVTFIRGVINEYNLYHYRIDLRSYLEGNFNSRALFNPMYLMSEYGKYKGVLLVQNNNNYLAFGQFKFPNNTLACTFAKEGDFEISFTTDKKCIGLAEVGPEQLDYCKMNYIFKVNVIPGDNKSLLYAIIAFLIITSILIVSVVVIRFFCKRRATKAIEGSKYMKEHHDPGMLEIQSTNSKRI
jgi:hypothetical protein